MGKFIKVLLGIFFILLITSNSFSQENPLIGKWEVTEGDSKITVEFLKDGTCIFADPYKIISEGTYTLSDNNQIEMQLRGKDGSEKKISHEFFLSTEGLLKLCHSCEEEENGKSYDCCTIFKRVTEQIRK